MNGYEAATHAETLRTWAVGELGSAFEEHGLDVVDAPAPGTMIVRVQFIDFTATPVSEEALAWTRNFGFDVKPGRVTMVTGLIDARSGDTVIRMADMQDGMSQGIAGDLQSALTG